MAELDDSTSSSTTPQPEPVATLRQRKPGAALPESKSDNSKDGNDDDEVYKDGEEVTWGKTPSGVGRSHDLDPMSLRS